MSCATRDVGAAELGPFFEPNHPFFHTQVELVPPAGGEDQVGNFVVRGILLPVGSGHCVLFDQELLRVAAIWEVPAGEPLTTLKTMPQISYENPRRKVNAEHPQPTGPVQLIVGMHPGAGTEVGALFQDPRPPNPVADAGRGPLPTELARFHGTELRDEIAVLRYEVGGVAIREWHTGEKNNDRRRLFRHLEIEPHSQPLFVTLGAAPGATWHHETPQRVRARAAQKNRLWVTSDSDGVEFREHNGELVAVISPSTETRRVSVAISFGETAPPAAEPAAPLPKFSAKRRWPESVTSTTELDALQQNGLALDYIGIPEENPWRRRIRPADIAFLSDDRGAVVTYDGDVWTVEGFADPSLQKLTWRRFASGLHESLGLAIVGEAVQVTTKNGVVRLHDRDANGEADWIENFSDYMIQSQTTRSFPLDMGIGPDGSTYISQGGIVAQSGIKAGGEGTPHTGAIIRVAPDGRTAEVFASAMREPFVTVHPKTGVVTATDQQGHYIPSSVVYLVRRGDRFGFLEKNPAKLTPPLVWIPHTQDISSSSQEWIIGEGMGPWNGKLLHLSYGTGRMFIISPDLDAPTPQGAVIPLDLKTNLPLLQAQMHPRGDAVFLAGFQIWGTRTTTRAALGRLRAGTTPIVTPLAARAVKHGVVLDFAQPLAPESLLPEKVFVRAWNYKRSPAYGSGRYTLDGPAGTTPWGVAQVVPSHDKRSLFVHIPSLVAAQQVEVRYEFSFADASPAHGVVYFTIHEPPAADLVAQGFPRIDLKKPAAVVTQLTEPPATPRLGRTIAESLGCLACHSVDGSIEGKIGPTWKGLFGATREFVDGRKEIADELYLREKILDPQQKKLKPGVVEMPSYRGVVSEQQLEALVLYIKSLGRQLD